MKKLNILAAVALAALAAGACSVKETPVIDQTPSPEGKVVTLVATLGPKGGADVKALTDPGDGTLSSTWAVNEEIEVLYEKSTDPADSPSGSAIATVTTVDGSGNATISVILVDPKDGDTGIYFHYPYSLATGTKDLNDDQVGTLADVAANFDDVTGDGSLNVSGGVATLPTGVVMTRNVCVWKFTFTDGSSDITSAVTALNIKVGTISEYNVTPSAQSAIYVAMFKADNQPITITATTAAGAFSRTTGAVSLAKGKLYTSTALALIKQNTVALGGLTANYTASNGDVLTGSTTAYKVTIPNGATVTLNNATIAYANDDGAPITCAGNATIILSGTNNLSVPGGVDDPLDPYNSQHMNGYPAILAGGTGKKLTITGGGTLNAIGGYIAAGIGCLNASYTGYGANYACGVIQIDGGTINAYSGYANSLGDGAEVGIGAVCGGPSGDGCDGIIINGGVVTAEGGAAGIGGAGGTTVNYITINGGEVTARSHGEGAGIGTTSNGQCGDITITGGTVNAYGAQSAAGIGTGCGYDPGSGIIYSRCGNIIITGGLIVASGDEAGIGTGSMGQCGDISISGGNITSTSLNGIGTGPGIGSGMDGVCGTIAIANTITQLIAKGGSGVNPAIGAGMGTATCGTITINTVDIAGETINDGANTIGGMTLTQTEDSDGNRIWTIIP